MSFNKEGGVSWGQPILGTILSGAQLITLSLLVADASNFQDSIADGTPVCSKVRLHLRVL